ncbi:unnamed protein product [Ambrosiozyma monospora]|uniref:Unnamed protein product n=1 Tax=Ambrosiozyma monospora TaxID=43982 RepID=A0ACB5T3R1_AMBMO|nr:unnamed protein product [Ambrosiozyma monospora]
MDDKDTHEFEEKVKDFEDSKLLNTFNYSIAVERAWLFKTESEEVISFFENSGEQVEETVFFDFLRNLKFHGEMDTDECVCFENILSASSLNFEMLVKLYQSLLYKFKVDLNTKASTKRLQKLHLMTDELNALKLRVVRLAKMVGLLTDLPKLATSTPYMLELKETLEGHARTIEEMIDSIKNLIDLTFNQVAANTNKYMFLLALVSMVFLPMSFVTSFFGMNYFSAPLHHIGVFWASSISLTIFTVCFVGFPTIKRALSDSFRWASKIYKCFSLSVAFFRQAMELQLKKKRSQNESPTSTTTTQSHTRTQIQGSGTDVVQARSSTGQAVRPSISSNSRQGSSNNDVNSNHITTQPNMTNALNTPASSRTNTESILSRPNDYSSQSRVTARQSNFNLDIQNQDCTSASWGSDENV